jgi:hypothetical protein
MAFSKIMQPDKIEAQYSRKPEACQARARWQVEQLFQRLKDDPLRPL